MGSLDCFLGLSFDTAWSLVGSEWLEALRGWEDPGPSPLQNTPWPRFELSSLVLKMAALVIISTIEQRDLNRTWLSLRVLLAGTFPLMARGWWH